MRKGINKMKELFNEVDIYGNQHRRYAPTTLDKNLKINIDPHYTDPLFEKEFQTIFGERTETIFGHPHLEYEYLDRLYQWYPDKVGEVRDYVNSLDDVVKNSCRWYEIFLSKLLDKNVEIQHIVVGIRAMNGYSWASLGYIVIEDK